MDSNTYFVQVWDNIIQQATRNVDILKDPATVKQLGSILKTNVRACKSVGHYFVLQVIVFDLICCFFQLSSTFFRYSWEESIWTC